jgi:Ca2+-binding RTX toxin-like protein
MATQFNANTFDAINNIAQHYGSPTNIVSAIQDIKDSRNPLGSNFTFENALDTSSAVLSSYQAIQSSFGTLVQLAKATPSPGRVLLDVINLEITLGSMANSAFTEQKIDSSDVYSALATVASIGSTLAFGTALAASSPLWASAAVALTVAGVGLSYAGMMNGEDTIDVTNALQSIADFSQKAGDGYDAAYAEFQQAADWTGKTIEQLNDEIQPVIQDIVTYADYVSDVLGDTLAGGYYDSREFIENTLNQAGDWYNDLTNWFNTATKLLPPPVLIDPIIVDLDGDGIEMIPRQNNNVFFDMDGDGLKEWTGWINKDDAFLAIDENNNGIIDSVKELIGEQNTSGFTEFKNYDSNGDKVFDNKDTLWSQIKVWQDLNTDGISDANELKMLADVGIKSIDLHYTAINLTAAGNQIHETSIFERTDGTTGTIVDAWLDVDRIAASITLTATGNVTIDTLPDIRGFGNVSSLRNAMLNDSALATLVSTAVTLSADQINNLRDTAEQIVYRWADVQDVAIDSRGINFDGRKLAVLEKFVGHNFVNTLNQTNPNVQATPLLNNAWEKLLDSVQARLAIEGAFKGILPIVYDVGADRFISILDTDGAINTLKNAQPSDTLQAAKYWGAFIPVINRIVDDAGGDSTSPAHIAKVTATLADIGLGKFQNFLVSGVESATLPSSGSFATNGVYTLSDSSETITLTGATQAIYALSGNDTLIAKAPNATATFVLDGGNGDDVLRGSDNADWLNGGSGSDSMFGSAGDDIYFVDNTGDVVRENRAEGNDTVRSDLSYILGNNLENLELFGTGDFYGTGNALVNKIIGNAGANVLTGYEGNDILDGGSNADTLIGGIGNDTYVLDNTGDVVIEKYNEGLDSIQSNFSYVLANSLENLLLLGTGNINATGNAANNVITGNAGNNILDGKSGNDTLAGKAGDDIYWVNSKDDTVSEVANGGMDTVNSSVAFTLGVNIENLTLVGETDINGTGNILNNHLIGNSGANSLDGKTGVDTLEGGASDDTYTVDNTVDVVVEINDVGIDTVNSSVTYALSDYVENLTLLTTKAINGTGNDLNNQIIGNVGVNSLMGGAGNDFLDGKAGADNLDGGIGDDIYVVDNTSDKVIEGSNTGIDTIQSNVSWTLGADVENLTLSGVAVINATGNEQNNRLIGNAAKNVLDGKIGADVLMGLGGDDIYFIDNVADKVTENLKDGIDTINSTLNYVLGDNLENLNLLNTALNGTGNALNNTLVGNANFNLLIGNEGNDNLDGGSGADTLIGGIGNDTYIIDNIEDVVIEGWNGGTDKDTVQSVISYTLGKNLENLILLGSDAINGSGNVLNNSITGNTGDNILDGKSGNDTLKGGMGNDSYYVDSANDQITEIANSGIDNVYSSISYILSTNLENLTLLGEDDVNGTGNTSNNILIGNSGANTLDGKAGADTLKGGLGDDTYYIDNTGDVVVEDANAGVDTISSTLSYTLNNIENLTLLGTAAINGTGNTADNVLIGNTGNNSLIGGEGNDFLDGVLGADNLSGGTGDDIYVIDNVNDVLSEAINAGIDTVRSSLSHILPDNFENLILTGTAAIDANGNALENQITGNSAANVLDGKGGADTLVGLEGNDTYLIDNVGDTVWEGRGEGNDSVKSLFSYVLGDNLEQLFLQGTGDLNGTGNELNNAITGNAGSNLLNGGSGNDTLTGGAGIDTFQLTNVSNIDKITDFVVSDDSIQLDNAVFTSLGGEGVLLASKFRSGTGITTAADSNDYLIYNSTDGKLYYDGDAVGSNPAVQIALLGAGLVLTNADFMVI